MYDSGTASGMCPERSASMPYLAGAPGAGEVLVGPGHFQGNEIQEFHGGSVLADGIGGDLALVEEIELILADGLDIEILGAGAEILGEGGYLRVPICESFRLMPPSWFLRFWTDQAYLG